MLVWLILPGYRRLSKQNLRIAFGPSLTDKEVSRIALKHFLNLGANIICAVKIPAMSMRQIRSRLVMEREENWIDWVIGKKAGKRGTVIALSHSGNWEINAQIGESIKPRPAGCIYQALRNPLMDDLVNGDRRSRGVITFDRKKEMQAAVTMLKEGGAVGTRGTPESGCPSSANSPPPLLLRQVSPCAPTPCSFRPR
jgi:lauroyl/myristoyl acyltransferase